jgi:glycosyltransferase involved in cell wall biosynthesis
MQSEGSGAAPLPVSSEAGSLVGGNGRVDSSLEPASDVQAEAVRAFSASYPDVTFSPVVVIIPAYNEEACIGAVLSEVPREAHGLDVDTLVVDDGSADGTSEAALAHGVYVARLGRNSGQGSALRAGYRLAREHGARFIVTLDADGQWDPADLVVLLEAVVNDEADLVLGSRKLGRAETTDSVRRAGVHVFAKVLRLLTGVPITDTSSGVRAMRAEVTATVRQKEPQYQATELLIGAIYQGYRTAERPVVMRRRLAGKSKKGHNVLYGLRYGRVMLRTWWRESRSAKRRGTSPVR